MKGELKGLELAVSFHYLLSRNLMKGELKGVDVSYKL